MENNVNPVDIINLFRNPAFIIGAVWAIRELWHLSQKKSKEIDLLLQENVKKMSELTIAIVRLETKLEAIESMTYAIPKLEKDISALHRKFREGQ